MDARASFATARAVRPWTTLVRGVREWTFPGESFAEIFAAHADRG